MTVDDVVGAAFLPTDGQASPSDIVQALARGARSAGVTIREDIADHRHPRRERRGARRRDGGGLRRLREAGHLRRPMVARDRPHGGRQRAARLGAAPIRRSPSRSPASPPNLPTLRDPDRLTYYKEEVGGLIMGGYEPNPIPWAEDGIPDGFHYTLLDPDWDHFTPIMELALPRVPALREGRHQAAHQRPGELYAGRQLHPRRGAGGARTSSSAPASTPSASRRAAAPAWRSPNGWRRASRPTISGRSTSAASAATISTWTGCGRARSRPTPSTTRWPGRSRSIRPAGRSAARRSTTG